MGDFLKETYFLLYFLSFFIRVIDPHNLKFKNQLTYLNKKLGCGDRTIEYHKNQTIIKSVYFFCQFALEHVLRTIFIYVKTFVTSFLKIWVTHQKYIIIWHKNFCDILTVSVSQENRYAVKNMLLLKNPQFLPNHYEILSKWGTNVRTLFWQSFVMIG